MTRGTAKSSPLRVRFSSNATILLLGLGTVAAGYFDSTVEPEGCFSIFDDKYLLVSEGFVNIVSGQQVIDRTQIIGFDRIRGFVLQTNRKLIFNDDGMPVHFDLNERGELVIYRDSRGPDRIQIRDDQSQPKVFREVECPHAAE